MHWSLENISWLHDADISNVAIFHYTSFQKNSHLLISPRISSEKFVKYWKLSSSQWQMHIFQIFKFHLEAHILSLATKTVSCFPWSDKLTLFIFEKSLPDIQVWVTIVCLFIVSESKNWCAMKNMASSANNSKNCASANLWDSHNITLYSTNVSVIIRILKLLTKKMHNLRVVS